MVGVDPSGAAAAAPDNAPLRRRLPSAFELAAAFVPVVAIALLVTFKPSVLTHPSFYFVYAFLQAVVVLLVIRFLDLYEREPLTLLAAMALWGGLFATTLSLAGNGIVFGALGDNIQLAFGPAISAPLVEESAKGLALVAAFGLSRWANRRYGWLEFEGVTDGIVYGAAVGLGFALVEDIFYFFSYSDESVQTGLEVFLTRVDFFGATMLGHAVFTAAFGAGLGLATWSATRAGRIGWPLAGLGVAMLLHSAWNGIGSLALWVRYGWDATVNINGCIAGLDSYCSAIPADVEVQEVLSTLDTARTVMDVAFYASLILFGVAIALWLRYQRDVLRVELAPEVESGLVSKEDGDLVRRYVPRAKTYWGLLRAGRMEEWRILRRLHNELVDLAFLKLRARSAAELAELVERRRRRIGYLNEQLAAARRLEAT